MAEMDILTLLEQLNNPAQDLGGAPREDDAKALAQLQIGGGSAAVEGQALFGGATPNPTDVAAARARMGGFGVKPDPQLAQDILTGTVRPEQVLDRRIGQTALAPAQPNIPAKPLRPAMQEVLDTADQITTSLTGTGTPVSKTLLPNPYGPGSYDPNDAQQVADVKAQGAQAQKIRQARDMITQLALNPAFAGSQKEIVKGVLESLGVVQSDAQKEFAKAKAHAEGALAGQGMGGSGDDTVAQKIANYEMPLPSSFALKSPYWQSQLKRAVELNPSFDATQYQARQRLRNDFASGKAALNVRSLNTAVDHLDALRQASEALENGDVKSMNAVVNFVRTATGNEAVTNFKTAATAIESELAAVFKGTGATDQEIKQWRANFSENLSPAQLQGVIKGAVKLMSGRASALGEQWRQTMGKEREEAILSPEAQERLRAMGIDPADADPTLKTKAKKQGAPKGKGIPEGAVNTGRTSGGKPVFKGPDGQLYVED